MMKLLKLLVWFSFAAVWLYMSGSPDPEISFLLRFVGFVAGLWVVGRLLFPERLKEKDPLANEP